MAVDVKRGSIAGPPKRRDGHVSLRARPRQRLTPLSVPVVCVSAGRVSTFQVGPQYSRRRLTIEFRTGTAAWLLDATIRRVAVGLRSREHFSQNLSAATGACFSARPARLLVPLIVKPALIPCARLSYG